MMSFFSCGHSTIHRVASGFLFGLLLFSFPSCVCASIIYSCLVNRREELTPKSKFKFEMLHQIRIVGGFPLFSVNCDNSFIVWMTRRISP